MGTIEGVKKPGRMRVRSVVRFVLGAVFGAIVGAGCVSLAVSLRVPVKTFQWSDTLAMTMGGLCACLGLLIFVISLNRRELARNLEGEDAQTPASKDEVWAAQLQSASLFLAGVMLMIPLAAMGKAVQVAGGMTTLYGAIVVLFAAQTAANVMVWRLSDEFLRRQMLVAGALTFFIGQGALFLRAAAERMHLAQSLTSWQSFNLVLAVYLAIGTFLGLRARAKS